jgi:lipoate-protein ligase A
MMREEWRLIDTGVHDAYYNMALDEAIVIAKSRGLVPVTLRLFRWAPSAVSIGYFQSMEDEVDVNVCKQMGVDCVRRRTGGGAVYHDTEGELTYSLIIEEENPLVSVDFQKTYETLCAGLVRGLQLLGVSAAFKPINDIVVDGRKISGNAQTRSMKVVHQHGTILRTVNPTRIYKEM